MPNTSCLIGPPFSIQGNPYFADTKIDFQVAFDKQSDKDGILAYQWYLDNVIIVGQNAITLNAEVLCGAHTIGVRVLSKDGWSGIKSWQFHTCKVPVSIYIDGPSVVDEGKTAQYYVIRLFSDQSTEDVTEQYTFTSSAGGSFDGNTFTTPVDNNNYNPVKLTIKASKDGAVGATKPITVNNTTLVKILSLEIYGKDEVYEGASTDYTVYAAYSDGSRKDVSNLFTFSCTEGSFVGRVYTAPTDPHKNDTRPATIKATRIGLDTLVLSKNITIKDITIYPGILVVDLYNNDTLNVVGMANDVAGILVAHTGANIVPASVAPSDAMILASDLHTQNALNWRFEFDIGKLSDWRHDGDNFQFYVKGRSIKAGSISGAFSLKSHETKMVLSGSSGSYMPTVSGGVDLIGTTDFKSLVVAGANGSYNQNDLTNIIWFNYNAPNNELTYHVADAPIEVQDFDFMAIRYHWEEGSGTDLDVLVGYENNGTDVDNKYVGFSHNSNSRTIPAGIKPESNAYLWWAADSTGRIGYECVLIGINKFIADFPGSPNIVEVGLYAVWFGPPEFDISMSGNFTVELVTYKGGTMKLEGSNFVNQGGVQVSSNIIPLNTRTQSDKSTPETSYKVGTLKYNKTTKTATIKINEGNTSV